MKKYLYSLFCMAIGLTLLSGCETYNDNSKVQGNEDTLKEANSNDSADTPNLEPTIYETVNNFDRVTMNVKSGTVSSSGLTVILVNKSDKQVVYGEDFLLEKNINGKWYQVPVTLDGELAFPMIGYDLNPSDVNEWTIGWDIIYGNLDAGEYRIVKDVLDFRKSGDYDNYNLAAEFTVN